MCRRASPGAETFGLDGEGLEVRPPGFSIYPVSRGGGMRPVGAAGWDWHECRSLLSLWGWSTQAYASGSEFGWGGLSGYGENPSLAVGARWVRWSVLVVVRRMGSAKVNGSSRFG